MLTREVSGADIEVGKVRERYIIFTLDDSSSELCVKTARLHNVYLACSQTVTFRQLKFSTGAPPRLPLGSCHQPARRRLRHFGLDATLSQIPG